MTRRLVPTLLIGGLLITATAAGAGAKLVGFQSPSENIGCYMSGQGARCDIREHSWPTPPKPADCDTDYGQGVVVDRHGKAAYVCAGDTTLDRDNPVLGFGEKEKTGRFKCKSTRIGMQCLNTRNGHGFLLSRDAVELF